MAPIFQAPMMLGAGGAGAGAGASSAALMGAGAAGGPVGMAAALGLSMLMSSMMEKDPVVDAPAPVKPESGGGGRTHPIPPFNAKLFSSLLRMLATQGQ